MEQQPFNDNNLVYDLRQYYAKIVGEHLIDVAEAKKSDNFPAYFKSLEDLYVIVKHKIEKVKIKTKSEVSYEKLKKDFLKKANIYRQAYLGKSTDAKQVNEIKEILNKMDMFLYKYMDLAEIFGSKRDERGL